MEEWEKEYEGKKWLSIGVGDHDIILYGPPKKETSKISGKEQNVFDAEVDGIRGFLSLNKTLGRLVVNLRKAGRTDWPLKFKVNRSGMGVKDTVIKLVT